ncbi:MAG TPA: hypothetical protein VLX44_12160 [Xanthobacteraceae bacterium]|nr:hypothetical protein [Xanthobacteraceae bacterium]
MTNSQIRGCGRPSSGRQSLKRRALASAVAAVLIVAGGIGHAFAQDADDDELPDTKFFKGILRGFGLQNGQENSGINYQERAPLVVPPTRDLPPPQADNPARTSAMWPLDQDEQRRKEAAARKKKESSVPWDWTDLSRQLSPNEMKKGATTAKDSALSKRSAETPEAYQQQSTPAQLGYTGGLFGDMKSFFTGNNQPETATFEAEPPRTSLTDPPAGYRSPSPAEPYGVGIEDHKSKPISQEDRVNIGTGSTSR